MSSDEGTLMVYGPHLGGGRNLAVRDGTPYDRDNRTERRKLAKNLSTIFEHA